MAGRAPAVRPARSPLRPRAAHRRDGPSAADGCAFPPADPVKPNFRLDYERLADALRHHRLIEGEALRLTLHQCLSTGALFPDLLVRDGMVSDWELARLCSETFNLPFLPVECYQPQKNLIEGLDVEYLRQYGLVPLDGFEGVLTVSMPGMVPTDVLVGLAEASGKHILPVVGTVMGNHSWLERNLPPPAALKQLQSAADGGEWTGIFDAGDAAVRSGREEDDAAARLFESSIELIPDSDSTPFDVGLGIEHGVLEEGIREDGIAAAADGISPERSVDPSRTRGARDGLRLKGDDETSDAA